MVAVVYRKCQPDVADVAADVGADGAAEAQLMAEEARRCRRPEVATGCS